MGGFDRSKLKATTKEASDKREATLKKGFDRNNLKIEVGDNVIRFFPYHPDGGGDSFVEARSTVFLEVTVPKKDADKKVIEGEFELGYKPIFNAKIHGGYSKDVVEEYSNFAKSRAIPDFTDNAEERKKMENKLYSNFLTKEKGINYQDVYVAYAVKAQGKDANGNWIWGDPGDIEIKKVVKDAMTEKAAELENPDPYSDAEEGVVTIIKKNKEGKKATDYYNFRLDMQEIVVDKMGKVKVPVKLPLTDGQLESWSKLRPLYERFVGSYKRSDFDKQIEGLQNFEARMAAEFNGFSVFQYEEFLDIVEQISNEIPEDKVAEDHNELPFEQKEEEKVEEKPTPKVVAKPSVQTKPLARTTPPASTPKKEVEKEVVLPSNLNTSERMAAIKAKLGKK